MARGAPIGVVNVRLEDVREADVSALVVASGYEPRCTHLASTLCRRWGMSARELGARMLVLDLPGYEGMPSRQLADECLHAFDAMHMPASMRDDGASRAEFASAISTVSGDRPGAVLVDYTAMPRITYLGLLEFIAEFGQFLFGYSVGEYPTGPYPVSAVGTIHGVLGLDTASHALGSRLIVFGLGYDGIGAVALAERLEADRIVAFYADPGALADSAKITLDRNAALLDRAIARFAVPLRDVGATCEVLRRLAIETRRSDRLVLVPVGPKPHILACGVVAAEFEHVGVLAPHLAGGGIKHDPPLIEAMGDIVISRLEPLGDTSRQSNSSAV